MGTCRALFLTGARSTLLFLLLVFQAKAFAAWPKIDFPPNTRILEVSDEMNFNGQRMQIQAFSSKYMDVQRLTAWFRSNEGHFIYDKVGDYVVLGQMRDGFYLTVQMKNGLNEVQGWLAISDWRPSQRPAPKGNESLKLFHWLPESQVLSHTSSEENGMRIAQTLILNGYSSEINKNHLIEMLAHEGFEFEPLFDLSDKNALKRGPRHSGGTLYFKGPHREAMAVIASAQLGKTSVLLQTIFFEQKGAK